MFPDSRPHGPRAHARIVGLRLASVTAPGYDTSRGLSAGCNCHNPRECIGRGPEKCEREHAGMHSRIPGGRELVQLGEFMHRNSNFQKKESTT